MATTLTVSPNKVQIGWNFTSTGTLADAVARNTVTYDRTFSDGTAANQCNRFYAASGTIGTSSALDLDLAGVLTDFFGSAITFARVKLIFVHITTDTAGGPVEVGGHATAPMANFVTSAGTFTDEDPAIVVRNGGCLYLCAPDATAYAVTATTADILTLTNTSGSAAATYKVILAGCSS